MIAHLSLSMGAPRFQTSDARNLRAHSTESRRPACPRLRGCSIVLVCMHLPWVSQDFDHLVALGIHVGHALFISALLRLVAWMFVALNDTRTPPGQPQLSDQQ